MKNPYVINNGLVYIRLNDDLVTVIDLQDLDKVNKFPNLWFADKRKNKIYVRGFQSVKGKKYRFYLHRWLFNNPEMDIDHIDGDSLNNRKENLRLCSHRLNMQNQEHRNPLSGERGVYFDKRDNTWYARVVVDGETIHLGRFKDKDDAIAKVRQARKDLMPFSKECRL